MRLSEIAALLRPLQVRGLEPGEDATEVTDLAFDSRRASPGSLFFCRPGAIDDGHRHAPAAVAAGAVGLVVERVLNVPVPQLVVEDARGAMSLVAGPFFGHPSRSLALAGVTGTNGKTTTTYMLDAIFAAAGATTGLIGTVETRFAGATTPGNRTTPESSDLQQLLRRMVDAGVGFCAMEVTSVGLAQGRVEGTEFDVSIFTNLTQDHLDYHGDLETYYRAKRALFVPERTALAVINVDDPYGVRLVSGLRDVPCVTYALDAEAGVGALEVKTGPGGASFRLEGAVAARAVPLPLHVRHPAQRSPGGDHGRDRGGHRAIASAARLPPGRRPGESDRNRNRRGGPRGRGRDRRKGPRDRPERRRSCDRFRRRQGCRGIPAAVDRHRRQAMRLTLGEVARISGATLVGGAAATPVSGCSVNSRRAGPGDLFVALPGQFADGHTFVEAALRAGAAAAIVARPVEGRAGAPLRPVLVVDDPLAALRALGAWVRDVVDPI